MTFDGCKTKIPPKKPTKAGDVPLPINGKIPILLPPSFHKDNKPPALLF